MINTDRLEVIEGLSAPAMALLSAFLNLANERCKAKTYRQYRDNFSYIQNRAAFALARLETGEALASYLELTDAYYLTQESRFESSLDPDFIKEQISRGHQSRLIQLYHEEGRKRQEMELLEI